VTSTFCTPISRAAFTSAKISGRPRCPVARIMLWRAMSSRERRAGSVVLPLTSRTEGGGGAEPGAASARWGFFPERQLGSGAVDAPGGFVGGVDGGHPDDFASGASGKLNGDGIYSADGVIERDRSVGFDARHGAADDLRALGGGEVVGFEDKAGEP